MVRRSAAAERKDDAIELSLARCWRATASCSGGSWSEAAWLPPWRELLRVYRRLERRGEVRGGRFVAGFSGEQFALPEAIGMLRATRRQATTDQWVSVSGADPLNLVGILTPGAKLPALAGNRLLYRDGFRRPCWPRVIFSFSKLSTMRGSGRRRKPAERAGARAVDFAQYR